MSIHQLILAIKNDWCHPVGRFAVGQIEEWIQNEIAKKPELQSNKESILSLEPPQLFARFGPGRSNEDLFSLACGFLAISYLEREAPNERIGPSFEHYANHSGNSSARGYQIGAYYIVVEFIGSPAPRYVYDYRHAGLRAVEYLKLCAKRGTGLASATNKKYFRQGDNCSVL